MLEKELLCKLTTREAVSPELAEVWRFAANETGGVKFHAEPVDQEDPFSNRVVTVRYQTAEQLSLVMTAAQRGFDAYQPNFSLYGDRQD